MGPKTVSKMSNESYSSNIKAFAEELDEVSLFVQKFADTHVFDQIRVIKDPDETMKRKMDTLDWLARNSEFISTDAISNCLKEYKELYMNHNPIIQTAYISSRNHSLAVINILHQIDTLISKSAPERSKEIKFGLNSPKSTKLESEDTDYKISLLYSILEPLLINDYNVEKAMDMDIIDTIMRSIEKSLKEKVKNSPKIYQKYIMRCLTSIVRTQRALVDFIKDQNIEVILEILREVRDEEILANANKILRIVMRDDHDLHTQMEDNWREKRNLFGDPKVFLGLDEGMLGSIINSILEELNVHDFSELVLVEATAAILNFVKRPELIKFIIPQNISYLINIIMENHDKPRVLAIQSLQHISKKEEYKKYISQLGADDILEINI
jgi:hypothetical protein